MKLYREGRDDEPDEDAEATLPELTAEQALRMLEVLPEQHFTQPPPRYSEATLVKKLEEEGIGRPSTYASIISTIQDRGYVRLEDRRFKPEDVGYVVTDKLVEHFPDVVDVNFTRYMEKELDDIAEGQLRKVQMLEEFNAPFERALEKAEDSFERYQEDLDELCPLCPTEGRQPGHLQVKLGRYGKFIGCPNYPDCRYIRNMDGSERPEPELLDELCPECGRQLQRRVGRYGPFVGCSGYPDCHYIKKDPPRSLEITCPQCNQGQIVEKRTRFGVFYGCDRYPECDFAVNNEPLKEPRCPVDGSLLVSGRSRSVAGGAARVRSGHAPDEGRRSRGGGRGARREVRRRAAGTQPAAKKPHEEEDRSPQEDRGPLEDHLEEEDGFQEARCADGDGAEGTGGRAGIGAVRGPTRVFHHGRGRRPPRHPSGDRQGSADQPGVRAPAGRDGHLVVRRLAGVHRGDGDRRLARRRDRHRRGRRRRCHDRADAARLRVRTRRRRVRGPARPKAADDRCRHRPRRAVRVDGLPTRAVGDLPVVLRIECLSLLWTPARDASLPNLVPRRQLSNANSLVVVSSYATLPIGGIVFAGLAGVAQGLGGRIPPSATAPPRSR